MCKHPEFLNKGVTSNLSFWKIILSATERMHCPELGKIGGRQTLGRWCQWEWTRKRIQEMYFTKTDLWISQAFQGYLRLLVFKQVPLDFRNSLFFSCGHNLFRWTNQILYTLNTGHCYLTLILWDQMWDEDLHVGSWLTPVAQWGR